LPPVSVIRGLLEQPSANSLALEDTYKEAEEDTYSVLSSHNSRLASSSESAASYTQTQTQTLSYAPQTRVQTETEREGGRERVRERRR
jgi:hypothetical protein